MRTGFKRIVSIMLVVCFCVLLFPNMTVTTKAATVGLTLSQLREKFPHGKYWNHADNPGSDNSVNNEDGYTSIPCSHHGTIGTDGQTCNAFIGWETQLSWQCMGYADKLGYDATGEIPRSDIGGWSTDYSVTALDSLKPGDIVRYKNNGHSIYVTAVDGDTVIYTDCNSDGHCVIRWDATISKAELKETFSYVRSAPQRVLEGTFSCNCSTAYAGTYICTTDYYDLNIRAGHGTSYDIIGHIPNGSAVPVIGASGTGNDDWAHVIYNGITGYVSMEFLVKQEYNVISSVSDIQLNVSDNSSQTISVSYSGVASSNKVYLDCVMNGDNFDYEFGNWDNNKMPLTVKAVRAGNSVLTVRLRDYNSDEVLATTSINVSVTAPSYVVSYSANGGDGAPVSQTKYYNTTMILTNMEPTRTYYTFKGWSTSSTDKTVVYKPGSVYVANQNITLYAVWENGCDNNSHIFTSSVTEPTCISMGYTTHTCKCGYSYKDAHTDMKRHEYVYTVSVAPTETSAGTLVGVCSGCNQSTTVTLPILSTADYTYTIQKEPSAASKGLARYVWSNSSYGKTFYFDIAIDEIVYPDGLNKAADGKWYYYSNNSIDRTYTGMSKNAYGVWYVNKGELDRSYTGMCFYKSKWIYVNEGRYDTTYTGMAMNSYGWWYMKNGNLDRTYTGMVENSYGVWYMKNGKLDRSYTGMCVYNGTWIYVNKGIYDVTYTGMARNSYGWWYIKNGKLDRSYTGMYVLNGEWIYVNKGLYDISYTGMAKNSYGWWYINNGNLDRTYTGLVENEYGQWYFKDGKLNTSYSGSVEFNGKTYTIKNGKVV